MTSRSFSVLVALLVSAGPALADDQTAGERENAGKKAVSSLDSGTAGGAVVQQSLPELPVEAPYTPISEVNARLNDCSLERGTENAIYLTD